MAPTHEFVQENPMTFVLSARRLLLAASACLLAACASTSLEGSWSNPALPREPISGPGLVVGVARDDIVRRVYEDGMVAQLAARGIKAMPSYGLVAGPLGPKAHDEVLAAARKAGARQLLSTAVIGQDREQVVTQDPGPFIGMGGYGRWYGAYWGMSFPVRTEVRSYAVYTAQTSLVDVAGEQLRWTARTRTADPRDVTRETQAFVEVIVKSMTEAKLLPPAK
jgi:hypothetical protein